jgi:hypothetical protein
MSDKPEGGFLIPPYLIDGYTRSISVWYKPWTWGKTEFVPPVWPESELSEMITNGSDTLIEIQGDPESGTWTEVNRWP